MLQNSGVRESHKELLVAAAYGLCSAFLFLLGFFGSSFASILLCFSFLSHGKLVGVVSSVITVALIALRSAEVALDASYLFVVPTVVVGCNLLKNIKKSGKTWWYPESFVLRDLVLASLLLLVLMSMTTYSEASVQNRLDVVIKLIRAANVPIEGELGLLKLGMTKCFLGLTVFFNVIDVISSFLIAHSVCKYLKKNIRPSFDMLNISLSPLLGVFPLVALTISFAYGGGSSCLFNGLAIASLVAPLMSGLSIVHFFAHNTEYSRSILVGFYLMFLLMWPLILLFILLLGTVDAFCAIRPLLKFKF